MRPTVEDIKAAMKAEALRHRPTMGANTVDQPSPLAPAPGVSLPYAHETACMCGATFIIRTAHSITCQAGMQEFVSGTMASLAEHVLDRGARAIFALHEQPS